LWLLRAGELVAGFWMCGTVTAVAASLDDNPEAYGPGNARATGRTTRRSAELIDGWNDRCQRFAWTETAGANPSNA